MIKHGNHGEERDEHMARVQTYCDAQGFPYPTELVQHLASKAKKRDDES